MPAFDSQTAHRKDFPDRVRVGLVQINSRFSGQVYLPLSVGTLKAYAQKHLRNGERYEYLPFVYTRLSVEEATEQLQPADLVGFSTYVWNFQLSLQIASRLKRQKPGMVIVFGGPHVPDDAGEFLRSYPFIDIACHGEGERIFKEILERVFTDDWGAIPSVSFLRPNGSCCRTPRLPRMKDLSEVPSPYLEGHFDQIIDDHPEEHWIAIWETNRGCPFACTFCDWGSATATKVHKWNVDRLYGEIDWFGRNRIGYVFCADANFGILPRDIDIARYCAEVKNKHGFPEAVSIQSTKNVQERSYLVQKILAEGGLNKAVVVSMQSLHPATLKAVKRDNISLEVFKANQRRFAADGIETMTDLILGMPEETYDSFAEGISCLIENGQHNRIQFNNLSILPNAEMGDPAYIEKYGMVIVTTRIVNVHGKIDDPDNAVPELQELVVGTDSMPKEDWARSRALGWMAGLLHFNKIFQIPLMVLNEMSGYPYRALLEFFADGQYRSLTEEPELEFPILEEVRSFFADKAREIQEGGEEYFHSPEWLDIYWPAEEFIFIKACVEGKLHGFFDEAETAIRLLLREELPDFPLPILSDAIRLNRNLIKLPFQQGDLELDLSHNIWEFYRSVLLGNPLPLEEKESSYLIDRTTERWKSWEEWYEKVVWFGNRKGAYLYGNVSTDRQLEGHF